MAVWKHAKITERYEIKEALGEGDQSRVFRARSLNVPRDFAIKIFAFGHGTKGDKARARAQREAEALSKFQHPHLVKLFEVIEIDRYHLALVMDYIDGTRLDWYVARNGMSIAQAVQVTEQIATAMYEAHRHRLIHRDIKPENIIVHPLASGDIFAHLFDFGIVRGPDPSSLTQGFIGSPEFASPEQSRGGTVDARTDIFGLGATFFFILTNRPPFLGADVEDAVKQRDFARAPRVSEYRDAPRELDELIADMMAIDPNERPKSMKEVIKRLDAIDVKASDLQQSTEAEAPPILLLPAEANEVTEASVGWDAEQVTELVVGPHVIGTRGSAVAFLDQNLTVHAVDPMRRTRYDIDAGLDNAPRAIAPWSKGVVITRGDGSIVRLSWTDKATEVREADAEVTATTCFPDGRVIVGMASGECFVEQPNGRWQGQRAGRTPIEMIAATPGAVAVSTPDGAMLVSALSFDVPLRHLGKSVDAFGFSNDGYLLGVARDGRFAVHNVQQRGVLFDGQLPPRALRVAFHDTALCAYLVDNGKLLRFRLGG